jgi:hypothetical protein
MVGLLERDAISGVSDALGAEAERDGSDVEQ